MQFKSSAGNRGVMASVMTSIQGLSLRVRVNPACFRELKDVNSKVWSDSNFVDIGGLPTQPLPGNLAFGQVEHHAKFVQKTDRK